MAASRWLSMGKSMERTNVHQDVTPETLTGGLGVTMDTITAILSCVKTPDLLTTLRIWATTCIENVLIRTTTASRVVSCVKKRFITHDIVEPIMSPYIRNGGSLPWLSEQNVGHTGKSEAQQRAASRLPYQNPGNKFRKNHSPTLSFMRFQPRTGRMKERRQAESQKMAAGVKS